MLTLLHENTDLMKALKQMRVTSLAASQLPKIAITAVVAYHSNAAASWVPLLAFCVCVFVPLKKASPHLLFSVSQGSGSQLLSTHTLGSNGRRFGMTKQ